MIGIAAPQKERLGWNLKAIAAAEKASDDHARNWLGSLLNNIGWSLFDEERYDEALDTFQKALAFREEKGTAEPIRIARWCVAKTLRVMGRIDEGLAIQRELEADPDHDAFVEEEIAECLYTLGQSDDAKPYFKIAYEGLSQMRWVAEDTERIERLLKLSE